jgi:hypothetical protein
VTHADVDVRERREERGERREERGERREEWPITSE